MSLRAFLRAAVVVALTSSAVPAQSLDLMIDNTGLSIGDSRIVRGIRLNFRDRNLERVDGINVTIWAPHEDAWGGGVNGVAVGLPLTGARRISGLGLGIVGVSAEEEFTGIGVGGFGIGAGGDANGILIGGFGVGAGGDVRGLTIGGFGAGAGSGVTGLQIGGFGVGSGGDVRGLTIGGFGAGAGGDVSGITIAGLAAGAGSTLRGFTLAGAAAGAPRVRGLVVSSIVGGHDVHGGILAPLYFRLQSEDDGDLGLFRGVSVSALNHVKGEQRGLTIGLINYAWELRGWQIGLINHAASNPPALRWLPLFNKDFRD